MSWLKNYTLYLFDFDGLLVNTEALHFAAYREMCRAHGCELEWDLKRFFQAAHFEAAGLQAALCLEFPKLKALKWETLYAEKKRIYQQLLEEGKLTLMPGVASLLDALEALGIRRAVATNSPREQVDRIKETLPLLRTIPLWVTREFYQHPKPAPDAYLAAIEKAGKPGDRVIGFEDSMRGLKALVGAGVTQPVLICPENHPQMEEPLPQGVRYFHSFEEIQSL